jgi:hypothetical protein
LRDVRDILLRHSFSRKSSCQSSCRDEVAEGEVKHRSCHRA